MNRQVCRSRAKGQAVLEYILLVAMISIVIAMTIRNTTRTIYQYWTGIAVQVAIPCADCSTGPAPPLGP